MAWCIYDNEVTGRREFWSNGKIKEFVAFELLQSNLPRLDAELSKVSHIRTYPKIKMGCVVEGDPGAINETI